MYSSISKNCLNELFKSKQKSLNIRSLSLGKPCNRTLHQLKLSKSRINLQKKKHIQYSSDYIQKRVVEYDLGVRRLALMMGEDPETFSSDDVQRCINYLFPSDLSKEAKPVLEHPTKVYPAEIAVKLDEFGRPQHHLYYTLAADFTQLMHDIYEQRLKLQKAHADDLLDKAINPSKHPEEEDTNNLHFKDSVWCSKEEIEKTFLPGASMHDRQFENLIQQLTRLVEEPNSYSIHEYIMKFRKVIIKQTSKESIPDIQDSEDGRYFVESEGSRKTAQAKVRLIYPGCGKITVNGKSFSKYFFIPRSSLTGYQRIFDVEAQVTNPLQVLYKKNHKVECESQVSDADSTNQQTRTANAVAIRLAVSRALTAFLDSHRIEVLRQAGLLAYDIRNHERKKPGQPGARKKATWKKR